MLSGPGWTVSTWPSLVRPSGWPQASDQTEQNTNHFLWVSFSNETFVLRRTRASLQARSVLLRTKMQAMICCQHCSQMFGCENWRWFCVWSALIKGGFVLLFTKKQSILWPLGHQSWASFENHNHTIQRFNVIALFLTELDASWLKSSLYLSLLSVPSSGGRCNCMCILFHSCLSSTWPPNPLVYSFCQ